MIRRSALAFQRVALFAQRERIAVETRRTHTFVAPGQILAYGVDTASRLISELETFVDISAFAGLGVPDVALPADAHVGPERVVGDALLRRRARVLRVARHGTVRARAATVVGVAAAAAGALAREAPGLVVAHAVAGARVRRALVDVHASPDDPDDAGEPGTAHALRHSVCQHALGVWAAVNEFTRICNQTGGNVRPEFLKMSPDLKVLRLCQPRGVSSRIKLVYGIFTDMFLCISADSTY